MKTTRRVAIVALLALGGGFVQHCWALDPAAWRAYEAVEEAWLRDRHGLLIEQCPDCSEAAALDLELKIGELQLRGLQFQYLSRHNPRQLRSGMWQFAWVPLTGSEVARMAGGSSAYRKQEEAVRRLSTALRQHPGYEAFRRAQTRLWKTPEYHSVHRRYSGRLQELNRIYGGSEGGGL